MLVSSTQNNPHNLWYSDEVLYELPEYDSENPDSSKVTFSAKWTLIRRDTSSNGTKITFGDNDKESYMSVKIVTEGIRE